MCWKFWKHYKKGSLNKGNVPGFLSSIQKPFIGYLVCDSQRLAPKIEEWIWFGSNPVENLSTSKQIVVIDWLVILITWRVNFWFGSHTSNMIFANLYL